MSSGIIARRYAGALFAFGRKSGVPALEQCSTELMLLREALRHSRDLYGLCKSPVFSVADTLKVLTVLFDQWQIGDPVRNFCRLLAEKKRLAALPAIAENFEALLDEEKDLLRGKVVTAVELDEHRREAVLQKLSGQFGKKLVLTFSVDGSLLGGITLRVGDRMLDASLRTQLSILKEQIKRGA